MNILKGNITSIETRDLLSLVKVAVGNINFTSIVIDTPETQSYLRVGNSINLLFKETEVTISTGTNLLLSISNTFTCEIASVHSGFILSEIELIFEGKTIKSIITTEACKALNLAEKDTVIALVKTNEIILAPNG